MFSSKIKKKIKLQHFNWRDFHIHRKAEKIIWNETMLKEKKLKFKLTKDGKVSTVGTNESKHLPWHSINTSLLYTF